MRPNWRWLDLSRGRTLFPVDRQPAGPPKFFQDCFGRHPAVVFDVLILPPNRLVLVVQPFEQQLASPRRRQVSLCDQLARLAQRDPDRYRLRGGLRHGVYSLGLLRAVSVFAAPSGPLWCCSGAQIDNFTFSSFDQGQHMISPPRQRPAPLGEIFRLVISASNTALMADVGEHALDNVRLDAELLVHNRAGKPSEVVQYKVWPRDADRRVERFAPRRPPLETATAPEHVIAGPWTAAKSLQGWQGQRIDVWTF